jgi:hypothetical protein
MVTAVVTHAEELGSFLAAARTFTGDAAGGVVLVAMEFGDDLRLGLQSGLRADYDVPEGILVLRFGQREVLLPVQAGDPVMLPSGGVGIFGLRRLTRDTWALDPSLEIPGELHAFVVLVGVPSPAPWERLIVTAAEAMQGR